MIRVTAMRPRLRTVFALLIFGCFLQSGANCIAEQFKAGDEIEVLHLGSWLPATVVKTNQRGDVLAEFEFASNTRQEAFKPANVRYAYEAGALARARTWSDGAGKFKVKAALIEIGDEKITLRKPDKTEIKVTISKLSDSDQQFLKKLQKGAGGPAARPPQPPPLEDFEGGAGGNDSFATFGDDAGNAALEPDPLPADLKLKQGGVGFPTEDFFDRLGAVLAVGGKDAWVLAGVENGTPGKALPTRLYWASLARQKIEGRQLLPPGESVLDYHDPTHRVLTFAHVAADGSEGGEKETAALTLWEASPTDKQAKPLVRWKADSGERGHHEPWARIIDADVVLQRWKKQELVGWDTTAKQVRYRLTQASFFAPFPALSGGRKYIFLPEDKGVRIFESATGHLVSTLPAENGAAGVAISDDGCRAAVLSQNALTVWDLKDTSAPPQHYQAETIGTRFRADLFWVGDERVMADSGHRGQVLFSLKHKLSLWNYKFDMNAIRESEGHRVREIVGQHLVYGATVGNGGRSGLAVGAVLLPGPKVDEAEKELDPESLIVIKAGTPVQLNVQAGEETARVQAALEEKIKKNGWILSPTAEAILVAEMKRGDQQTITYRVSGFGKRPSEQTATVTPYISTMRLTIGKQVAWQSGTSSGAPHSVTLKEGETVQAEVDRWQHPNVEIFEKVEIPARIIDPAKRDGLGTTEVTNRGLVVKGERPAGGRRK